MQSNTYLHKNTRTGVISLSLQGNICGKDALALKETLLKLLKEGNRFVVVQAEQVAEFDLVAMNVLITMLKQFRDKKGELYLMYEKNGSVAEWLRLTKFDSFFSAVPKNLIA